MPNLSLPLVLMMLISTAVGTTILVSGILLRGFKSVLAGALSRALIAIAAEIALAIIADLFLHKPGVFSAIKIVGRIIEAGGVVLLVKFLVYNVGQPKET